MKKYSSAAFSRLAVLFASFCFLSCSPADSDTDAAPGFLFSSERILRLHAARAARYMPAWQKAGQVLMTGIDGDKSFSPYLYRHFQGVVPGAVLLFGYNIGQTAEQVRVFLSDCGAAFRRLGAPAPVLFAIDHEGGEVFRTGGLTDFLPSARAVAASMTPDEAEALYASAGGSLRALGITLNLAPVVESDADASSFLGSRLYSGDPEVAAAYAAAAVRGFRSSGVLCAAKHFPGNSADDPHSALPRAELSAGEFERLCLSPFRTVLADKPAAVLVSHAVFPAVDDAPFCLSRKGVSGILRASLGFEGLILTDDISMRALAAAGWAEEKAAVAAIRAGCDMVMTSSAGIRAIASAIAAETENSPEFRARLEDAVSRIIFLKMSAGIMPVPVSPLPSDSGRYGLKTEESCPSKEEG